MFVADGTSAYKVVDVMRKFITAGIANVKVHRLVSARGVRQMLVLNMRTLFRIGNLFVFHGSNPPLSLP